MCGRRLSRKFIDWLSGMRAFISMLRNNSVRLGFFANCAARYAAAADSPSSSLISSANASSAPAPGCAALISLQVAAQLLHFTEMTITGHHFGQDLRQVVGVFIDCLFEDTNGATIVAPARRKLRLQVVCPYTTAVDAQGLLQLCLGLGCAALGLGSEGQFTMVVRLLQHHPLAGQGFQLIGHLETGLPVALLLIDGQQVLSAARTCSLVSLSSRNRFSARSNSPARM